MDVTGSGGGIERHVTRVTGGRMPAWHPGSEGRVG